MNYNELYRPLQTQKCYAAPGHSRAEVPCWLLKMGALITLILSPLQRCSIWKQMGLSENRVYSQL